ncbi:hypothetical protein EJ02DRAFT_449097 [Clathrospora elynae]|uniref:Uncharacterized protein n=1 Tax=Clathrospora elynae TaxID=706981 RepID=A0A6A5T3P3_9PLEO|nr:hypothetical protein EJ02DRAFT_449097 [Clathrospora elynae]
MSRGLRGPIPSNSAGANDTSKDTLDTGLRQDLSNTSSELTSPMPSSDLSAPVTPLSDKTVATGKSGPIDGEPTGNDKSMGLYDCFNAHQNHPKGHFYSVGELFKRGVWIGYLAPHRQTESFRGLPSLSDLKVNHSRLSPPYPPTEHGVAKHNRQAICRGCATESSAPIALSEIQVGQKSKLVTMPLDGDDDDGVFCIMLPQKSDGYPNGLQSYRPYKITDGDRSDIVVKGYMVFALSNPAGDAGTLERVLAVLPEKERLDIKTRLEKRPQPGYLGRSYTPPSPTTTTKQETSLPPVRISSGVKNADDNDDESVARKRRKVRNTNLVECASVEMGHPYGDAGKRLDGSKAHICRTQQQTPMSPCPSKPPPQLHPTTVETIPLDLTDAQTRRIQIIWPIKNDDGTEYEFVRTLYDCKTFSGLLRSFEEDAKWIPTIDQLLADTKIWRLTYQLAGGAKKAGIHRKGTEIAFDRLQTTLAQSSVCTDNPNSIIEIKLEALG